MSYIKKPSVVKIDPTVTHLQPDQFDNDDPIQDYPFGTSAMRVTTATGFPEASGDVITSRTTDDTGSQIFIGEKAYIRAFEGSVWSSWRELGESGGGGPVEWDDIINKPSQFPPSPHTHDIEDIIGLQAALDDKAPAQSVNELQQEVDEHKAETTQNAHLAKNIGIEDAAGNFTATDVEGALNELFQSVSDGKDLIGGAITDVDPSIVIPPNPTFQDLANAISLLGGGGNGIKSIQSGTITLQRQDQITDVSISSVDPSKSIVFISVSTDVSNPRADNLCIACEIIDSTTVRLERYDASQTYLPTVTWTVIEFDNVKSLQTGRQVGTANPTIVNINSVDVSKSVLLFSHLFMLGSTSTGYFLTRGRISSPTTLEFVASASPNFHIYVWQVVEFE